jgi:hypothetical protein
MKDDYPSQIVADRYEAQGHGGLYELAEELTDKFEAENEGVEWGMDKEYFEEIQNFLIANL